jgi:hypothetical protein
VHGVGRHVEELVHDAIEARVRVVEQTFLVVECVAQLVSKEPAKGLAGHRRRDLDSLASDIVEPTFGVVEGHLGELDPSRSGPSGEGLDLGSDEGMLFRCASLDGHFVELEALGAPPALYRGRRSSWVALVPSPPGSSE